ncbi:hypothetical protein F5B18DRAFT_19720 [Nemania serpens]|nr:hypothetical protein F5B18DRAFT_19720 [Nemania serpens]
MPPVLDALGLRASSASASRSASRSASTFLHQTSSSTRAHNPRLRILSRTLTRTRAPNSRLYSTPPPSPPKSHARLSRILTSASRFLPSRLRASLSALRSAPLSHVGAFLLLHEATAVLPIFGLTYAFHALDWAPTGWVLGPWAAWAEDGLRRYVPYFRRKRWFGLESKEGKDGDDGEEELESELREEARREREREGREGKRGVFARLFGRARDADVVVDGSTSTTLSEERAGAGQEKHDKAAAVWRKVKHVATAEHTEKGYKIGIQIAAAYTITKLLLVPRIALSLWLTPWLARRFVGLRRAVQRKRS